MDKHYCYCRPLNAGLASETGAVARKLGKLFDAIDVMKDGGIVSGAILDDLYAVWHKLKNGLETEGWTVSYMNGSLEGSNRAHVYPPGSPTGKKIRKWRDDQ